MTFSVDTYFLAVWYSDLLACVYPEDNTVKHNFGYMDAFVQKIPGAFSFQKGCRQFPFEKYMHVVIKILIMTHTVVYYIYLKLMYSIVVWYNDSLPQIRPWEEAPAK